MGDVSYSIEGRVIDQISVRLHHLLTIASHRIQITLGFASEFRGPFIVEKPVHLIGQGATTLFGNVGPALAILCKDVLIENLRIDYAGQGQGIALLYLEHTAPQLDAVQVVGITECVKADHFVDIGNIFPYVTLELILPINVDEPAMLVLEVPGNVLVTLEPNHLPFSGQHLVHFNLVGHIAMGSFLGSIRILKQSGEDRLWFRSQVEATMPQRVPSITLQDSVSSMTLTARSSFPLSKAFFDPRLSCDHVDEFDTPAGVVIRESYNQWYLHRLTSHLLPMKLVGQALHGLGRYALRLGDVLEINEVRLIVTETPDSFPSLLPSVVRRAPGESVLFELVNPTADSLNFRCFTDTAVLQPKAKTGICPAYGRTQIVLLEESLERIGKDVYYLCVIIEDLYTERRLIARIENRLF